MKWGQGKTFPIQLLVNFWEMDSQGLVSLARELKGEGILEVTCFVPWALVESDTTQRLAKALSVAMREGMSVTLIPTLEVGLPAPFSGVPADLLVEGREAHGAQGLVGAYAPPNMFAVPSPFHPEFEKRVQGFLARIQRELGSLARSLAGFEGQLRVVVTGGIHRFVRDRDESRSATLAFRRYIDDLCARAEFRGDDVWKAREFEVVHRRSFFRLEEEVYRRRSERILMRGLDGIKCEQWNVIPIEMAEALESHWAAFALGEDTGWSRALFDQIEHEARTLVTLGNCVVPNYVHWLAGGPSSLLPEVDRQLLVLRSLLSFGASAEGGGIFIDGREWLRFSQKFRLRALKVARSLQSGEYEEHVWVDVLGESEGVRAALELGVREGYRFVENASGLALREGSRLVFVLEGVVLDEATAILLMDLARLGKTIAVSDRAPMTTRARSVIEAALGPLAQIEIEVGFRSRLHQFAKGRVVLFYEGTRGEVATHAELMRTFVKSMALLCDLEDPLQLADSHARLLDRSRIAAGAKAVFLFNPEDSPQSVSVGFFRPVAVSDLLADVGVVHAQSLAVELPGKGVVSLATEELDKGESHGVHVRLEEPPRDSRGEVAQALDAGA